VSVGFLPASANVVDVYAQPSRVDVERAPRPKPQSVIMADEPQRSAAPRGFDRGDVDLLHRHHRVERALQN
jgi:hypothetical protein